MYVLRICDVATIVVLLHVFHKAWFPHIILKRQWNSDRNRFTFTSKDIAVINFNQSFAVNQTNVLGSLDFTIVLPMEARLNYMCFEVTIYLVSKSEQKFLSHMYRYMYLKKAWYLKTYIDANSSTDFEKLHQIKN